MEPPHSYVWDASTSVVHHGDYLGSRDDHALCGTALENPAKVAQTERPQAVCPNCEAKLVEYHLTWWRDRATAATAELEILRTKYQELAASVADRTPKRDASQPYRQLGEDSSDEDAFGGEKPRGASTARRDAATPTSLLDRARQELLDLCRQFDEAVPFRRVKNTMQAMSDKLTPDERVLLAQEIGAHGSLIRWSTIEIEGLGLRVTGNPVQGETEAMWDDWTSDSFQPPPKQSRWRFSRSRSHDGG